MGLKFQLRSQFDLIQDLTKKFTDKLLADSIEICRYYSLPLIDAKDEDKIVDAIPVAEQSGNEAIKLCASAYGDYFRKNDKSARVLQRHPGILVIQGNETHPLIGYIKQLNQAKSDFKKLVLTIDNNDARFEAVHNAVPDLITLALYRKIHFETDVPYSVRFTWMHKHSTKTLSREQALKMLEGSARYTNPRMIDQTRWLQMVNQEKLRVTSLKQDQKLRIRRPTRVSPQVNVRFSAAQRYHVSAALPFILFCDQGDVKIGSLPDYHKHDQDPRKREANYLVERLYLEQG